MSNDKSLDQRLHFLKFDERTRSTIRSLKPFLEEELSGALDALYGQIRAFPETRRFFSDDGHIDIARKAQHRHWANIATGDYGDSYAAAVRKIGQIHASIGLEPRWYIGGYALIAEQLIHAMVRRHRPTAAWIGKRRRNKNDPDMAESLSALTKSIMLDIDCVISIYVEAKEQEQHLMDEEWAAKAAEQARVVQLLADGLGKLSDGNLTCRLNDAFPAEYEKLRGDFNASIEKLHQAMLAINTNAHAIRSGTDEISTAADDLSRRTEQQAASLEETAASLDQITTTVNKTAEGAKHAHDVVSTAKANAEKSGIVVRNAVEAMNGIEKSSKQISQIIGVIDEIAFQTNLLALNAGVEAARAGDAGRGFAVVASEVRALAQRSAEAAKEIKGLISTSTEQVDRGVDLVEETGKALERIVIQVAEINDVVSAIAASAQEQATGLHQVNTAVNQMDHVTQQNAAMVEETTAAAHSLSHETEELGRLVGRFQIGESAPVTPMRRSPAKPAPAARPALKSVATRGAPAAVRKAVPAEASENWEEF
ncbi:MAG: methyl-accepting chemotaxis protein [Beijerinckiaceae bacterium]